MPADWNEIRRLAASPERMQRKEALSQARVRLIEFLTDRGFAVQSGQVQDSLKRFFREGRHDARQLLDLMDAIGLRNRMEYEQANVPVDEVLRAVAAVETFIRGGSTPERSSDAAPAAPRPAIHGARHDPNRPQAHILTVNHQQVARGNDTGLLIRVTFNATGTWGFQKALIGAWFSIDGRPAFARGGLGRGGTPGEPLCVTSDFHPFRQKAYEDFELFLSHGLLPQLSSGSHTLGYVIRVMAGEQRGSGRRVSYHWSLVTAADERTLPITVSVTRTASVVQVKEEFVTRDGVTGLLIHVSLSVAGLQGRLVEAAAFFSLADGSLLPDTDGQYRSANGQVAVASTFTPAEEREAGRHVELFLPSAQLHLPFGRHQVRYEIFVGVQEPSGAWQTMNRSEPRQVGFTVTPVVRAEIGEIQEEEVVQEGARGLRIRATFTIHGMKDWPGMVAAYFFDGNGGVLRDLDGKFGSASGEASVGGAIKPAHDDALFEGFELFMPYAQLHLRSGTHALRYVVRIFEDDDPWRELAASPLRPFTVTWREDEAGGA
jgi:hypothetical protein